MRNVPDEVHRALRLRAAERGHSTEAEVRAILAAAVLPDDRPLMGQALAALGRELSLSDEDVDHLDGVRDRSAAVPPALT